MTPGWNRCRGCSGALTSGRYDDDETWTCNICGKTQPHEAHGGSSGGST